MFKKWLGVLVMISLLLSLSGVALADKTKVTVLYPTSRAGEMEKFEPVFEKENPNIDLIVQLCPPAEVFASTMLRAAAGTLPDVFWVLSDYRLDNLVNGGVLAQLDELVEKVGLDLSKYPKAYFDASRRDGKLWQFPRSPNRYPSLHYNQEILDASGLVYPTHEMAWEDFKTLCKKLVEKDAKGQITRYGVLNKYPPLGWVFLSGGRVVDDPLKPTKVRFNEDVFKNALLEYLEMNESGATMPLPICEALGGSNPKIFGEESTAMTMTDLGYCGGFATIPFEWGAVEPPHPEGADYGYHVGVYGWAVNARSENLQAAFSWVQWVILSESALQIKEQRAGCNHNQIPYAPELQEAYAKIAATRKPSGWEHIWEMDKRTVLDPAFTGAEEFTPIYWAGVWNVLYGRAPIESLDDVAEELQEFLDELNSRK